MTDILQDSCPSIQILGQIITAPPEKDILCKDFNGSPLRSNVSNIDRQHSDLDDNMPRAHLTSSVGRALQQIYHKIYRVKDYKAILQERVTTTMSSSAAESQLLKKQTPANQQEKIQNEYGLEAIPNASRSRSVKKSALSGHTTHTHII